MGINCSSHMKKRKKRTICTRIYVDIDFVKVVKSRLYSPLYNRRVFYNLNSMNFVWSFRRPSYFSYPMFFHASALYKVPPWTDILILVIYWSRVFSINGKKTIPAYTHNSSNLFFSPLELYIHRCDVEIAHDPHHHHHHQQRALTFRGITAGMNCSRVQPIRGQLTF